MLRDDIAIIATDVPGHLRAYARARIDRALASFSDWFDAVKVSLSGGGKEPEIVSCEIKVRLIPSGIWIIHEYRDVNPYTAIRNSAEAVARFLGRRLGRQTPLTTAA